jgi:hypothetical protein
MNDIDAGREEFLARLRRTDAETETFITEQRKLMTVQEKSPRERDGVILVSGAAIGGLVVKVLGG